MVHLIFFQTECKNKILLLNRIFEYFLYLFPRDMNLKSNCKNIGRALFGIKENTNHNSYNWRWRIRDE